MAGAIGDDDLARHFDGVNARVLALDARVEDTAHEGGGGPVEDRHLGTVDLHHGVVNAATGQRGHDMFDGGDGRPAVTVKLRAQAALRDAVVARRHVRLAGEVRAAEPQAHVGGVRPDGHAREPTGVETHAAEAHIRSDRCLHVETRCPFCPRAAAFRASVPDLVPGPPIGDAPAIFRGKFPPGSPARFSVNYGLLGWGETDNSTIMTVCNNADSSRQKLADSGGGGPLPIENKGKGVGAMPTPLFVL
jgi:hypothetical protein